jgi:hypothetical protein
MTAVNSRLPFESYGEAHATFAQHATAESAWHCAYNDGYRIALVGTMGVLEISSELSETLWRYQPAGGIAVKYSDRGWQEVAVADELDWANVPDPESVPEAKFSTWIVADSNVRILARAEDELHHVADLLFVNGSWLFYKVGRNGSHLGDGILLDVDPATEQHLRDMEIESRRTAANETVLAAHLAAIEAQRMAYCVESRDLASIAAFIKARRYWPLFYSSEK